LVPALRYWYEDEMDFEPSWDQAQVARTARELAARELAPRAAQRDRTQQFPEAEMRALGQVGLLGLCVPETYGGSAAGPVALALAIAELAQADASVAVTASVTNMVAETVARFAREPVRQRLLPGLCAGEAVAGAFALSEPHSGSDAAAMTTTAHRTDGGYLLRGAKQWITSGDRAGVLIVMARHPGDPRRFSAFVLAPPVAGLTAGRHERKMGQRGSSTVPLVLDDVFAPDDSVLGEEGAGFRVAMTALDSGRIGVAAQAVGIARAALAVAIEHVRSRQQFGQALGEFQAVKSMIADAATAIEASWLLVLQAAWLKQQDRPFTRLACEAKLIASERAVEVCDRAIQLLGGYGYTRELPVERYYRDVRVTTIYEGTSQIQRLVIARHLLRELGGHV
jgi:alkylation response protein AidB-like acyl-CoA dehydrogenase